MSDGSETEAPVHTEGTYDARFNAVREAFAENFASRGELGAAVSVTIDGKTVVDLWGGIAEKASGRPWTRDTLVVVFSCTKAATALCAHLLAARGHLDLDAPVARYWPEFAAADKGAITVRMLLNHQAGLPAIDAPSRVAIGYVMNQMGEGVLLNARGQALIDAVYECLG